MTFSPDIYSIGREGTIRSAEALVPLLLEKVLPDRVLDVGCGEGWFAREFAAHGCEVVAFDQTGPETDIPGVTFYRLGLPLPPANPLTGRRFDLAVCLEVAEHLPSELSGPLVDLLSRMAEVVVFSAAIPHQGGHGHVNEQWPGYWADLFAMNSLECSDDLRWLIWDDTRIEPWYRQNLFLFAKFQKLKELGLSLTRNPRSVVHPDIYGWKV